MNHDPLLDFVKSKLEEGETISDEAHSRLLTAAGDCHVPRRQSRRQATGAFLLAASLAVAACGWFLYTDTVNARRESDLANVIDLLRLADGETEPASGSIPENLLAWQDAPTLSNSAE